MKVTRSLAVVVALVFSLGSSAFVRAADDQPAREAAAEKLVETMKMSQVVEKIIGQMSEALSKAIDNAAKQGGENPDRAAAAQKLRAESIEALQKAFAWDGLKPEFVKAYADTFSESELNDLFAFYQTPTGQKLVAEEPALAEKINKITRGRQTAVVPPIAQKVNAFARAGRPPIPPGPARTPGTAVSTAPAAPSASPSIPPVAPALPGETPQPTAPVAPAAAPTPSAKPGATLP